ncbi:hypothetical protein FHL15_007063 [Xylaria flabelliformis]|uniref:CFEM domain-containing protein n=1 Tax=Xylaria flabelliformis TaxID=2512241 RepID=A0A553HVJ0_9PEZI|nr:hypothetical protein FHL15_007063 [Xylaria flabelliformis]
MMLRQVVATVVITILGLVSAQDSSTVPSVCAVGCVNGVFVNAASVGCANGDTLCVCNKTASFQDGIRDCITNACAPDGPAAQIPLADAYANDLCAKASASSAPPPAPTTSTPPPESTSTEAAASTTPIATSSTSTAVPSAESSPQSTTTSSSVVSTSAATSSSASDSQSTTTQAVSPTTSASTSVISSSTTSDVSAPAATSSTSPATAGLSTAAKAGIGAGVGAAVLAAIIIAICVCLRRRQQKKTASPVRNYKISEPMSATGSEFANNIGRAQTTGLPRPIITTHAGHLDTTGMATSPTSVYSNASDLESHARRYEEMPPRTQPRTMI